MRVLAMVVAILALAGCMPKPDIKAACETDIRDDLLNPETAEFHDFEVVDANTYKAAVIPPMQVRFDFPGGEAAVNGELSRIDSAAKLYRMRVRADGQLGNKVTKPAFCQQPVERVGACFCTLID